MSSASNEVVVRQELFGRLSLVLMRHNAQAILARSNWPGILGNEIYFYFVFLSLSICVIHVHVFIISI